jgi:hypothetical protein
MTEATAVYVKQREIDVDKLLAEAGQGYKLQIRRKEPKWCDGLLDTVELGDGEPLSLEEIREAWGGRKLELTLLDPQGQYVTCRTVRFPEGPRHEGKKVKREDDDGDTPKASPLAGFKDIVSMMLEAQKNNADTMRQILESRIAGLETRIAAGAPAAAALPAPPLDPMKQIRDSIATIKQLEDLRSGLGIGGAGDAAKEPTLYEKMIEEFFSLQLEKEKAKMKAAAEAAARAGAPPPPLPERGSRGGGGGNGKGNGKGNGRPPASSPSGNLSRAQLDAVDDLTLAALVRERYEKLPPADREKVLSVFMGQYRWQPTTPPGEDGEDLENGEDGEDLEDLEDGEDGEDLEENVDTTAGPSTMIDGVSVSESDRAILEDLSGPKT